MRQLWMSLQKFHVKSGLSTPLFARPRRRGCRSEPRLKIGGNLPQTVDANPSKLRIAQQASSCIDFKVYFLLCAFAYGMAIGLEFPLPSPALYLRSLFFPIPLSYFSCVLFCRFHESASERGRDRKELADKRQTKCPTRRILLYNPKISIYTVAPFLVGASLINYQSSGMNETVESAQNT